MNGDPIERKSDKPQVHGVQSGLAVVKEPQGATDFATLRSVTWDNGTGRMNVSVIGLGYQDAKILRDALEEIIGERA